MSLKKILLFCSFILTFNVYLFSQSTQGTDFWIAFLQNIDKGYTSKDYYTLELTITSKEKSNVKIENVKTGFARNVTLQPNTTQSIDIPFDEFNLREYDKVLDNKSLHITSSSPISVYLTNAQYNSMESSLALPTSACGTYYVTQMNNIRQKANRYGYEPAIFCVIATEDDTEIEIRPSLSTGANQLPHKPFTVKLNAGDVYAVESSSKDQGKEFSGSQIRSYYDKKIAVFVGNKFSCVPEPTTEGDGDNLMDVSYPVSSWGKEFMIIPYKNGKNDMIKITAANNGAVIYKDKLPWDTLKPFETHTFMHKEADGAFSIKSTEPVEIYQYMTSNRYDGYRREAGPSFMYVTPLEQAIEDITFTYFVNHEIKRQFINFIINAADTNLVMLDGKTKFCDFSSIPSLPEYKYAQLELTPGSHKMKAPNGVNANLYGIGEAISYAYSAGSKLTIINPVDTFAPYTVDCAQGTVLFREDFGDDFTVNFDSLLYNPDSNHIMKAAMPFDTTIIYDDLNPDTQYYLSLWCQSINSNSDVKVKLTVEDLEGNIISSVEQDINSKKKIWQNVGTNFTMPEGQTYAVFKVYAEGDKRDSLIAIDNIELRLCVPSVDVNHPTDTLCVGSDFTIKAEFKNEGHTFIEPINYTWFKNITGGYEKEGWEKVGTDKYLDLIDLNTEDTGYYKVVVSSAGEEGEFNSYNATSDAIHIIVAECIPEIEEEEEEEEEEKIEIETENRDTINNVEIPTAFTPHFQDGLNDLFMPGYEVYIYDRYGNLVCHSENGWNGTYRGKTATPGVYVYTLFMKDGEQKKGTIEVVKNKK